MKLLFNNTEKGKEEIKSILGFLDGDFNYDNIEPDIILRTPELIEIIGQGVYDKIFAFYEDESSADDTSEQELLTFCLKLSRLYVLSLAYLDYAPDNDLSHTNSGRTFRSEDDDKIPWEWQVSASNSSIKKRAYKALDRLLLVLDGSQWIEWTESDQYTASKAIFITNTNDFDKIFPINKSGQLYYRLVPFMDDIEKDRLRPILTPTIFNELKVNKSPLAEEETLISNSKKAIAYLSLSKAFKVFPVEMFPDGLVYRESSKVNSEVRAEVMQFLKQEGENYLIKLQHELTVQNQTFEELDPTRHLDEDNKYVSL